jgi:hypothetical protein
MSNVIYDGKIDGEFNGFDDEILFKMRNGTYWIQAQYEYWYHYAYCPNATITKDNGKYILTVFGKSIPVKRTTDVIESHIDGEFKGWQGNTSYKLNNGQIWEQCSNKYENKNANRPEAIVYATSSGYKMLVAGTIANVRQIE